MRYLCMVALAACGGGGGADGETDAGPTGGEQTPTSLTQGACGQVHLDQPVTLVGEVELGGAPAAGATVVLEERNWEPGRVYGDVLADAGGGFQIDASITVIDGCWGTGVDYWLTGELDGATGEVPVDSFLFNAIEGTSDDPGDGVAELAVPLTLEAPPGS